MSVQVSNHSTITINTDDDGVDSSTDVTIIRNGKAYKLPAILLWHFMDTLYERNVPTGPAYDAIINTFFTKNPNPRTNVVKVFG